jgi:acyl-CoA dehydrogenase family member 9
MAELGLMGLNIPEAYGGFGASAMVFNRVFGEIGAHDASLAVYFGAHQSIGIKGIILFGTEAQKQRWLPRCATGELVGAFCLTEPGSGSDAQAMLTTAVPSDGRHALCAERHQDLDLQRGYAGVFTVFAKVPVTGGRQGEAARHRVHRGRHEPGISLGKIEEKMGIKASDTRTVTFENVRVPRRGPARRGRRRLQDRARDPQLRAARPLRRLVARHPRDDEARHRARQGA